ncbi:phenylacetate--CoA ligase family protein [Caldicellulosiruptoraceae bacterium PP1]
MDLIAFAIRNLVFPYMEIVKGNTIRKKMKFLKSMEKKDYQFIKKKQEEELKKLLLHCIENVRAYEHLKYLKDNIEKNPYEALSKFPILTKKEFNKNKNLYMAKNIDPKNAIPNKTGGSTGEPVNFYMDRETVEWYEAARWQGLSRFGIKIGDRSVMIWASQNDVKNTLNNKKKFYKELLLKNRIIIPAWDINKETFNMYFEKINRFKPLYIYGYPSYIYQFAKLMLENNKRFSFKLKGVVTTAENLYGHQRELIEKAFDCPVINEYGARDAGILAFQCKNNKMHLNILNAFYEIIDKDTKKEKKDLEQGLIVVTDLHNYIMPRLRYVLGDVVTFSNSKCSCGIETPILKEIDGRDDEFFLTKTGEQFDSHFFNIYAREMKGVYQYQIIQHSPESMTLKIVKAENFDEKEVEDYVSIIKERFKDIDIKIEYVENIPVTNSGKVRYTIREYSYDI